MAYTINLTDGTIFATIADGTVNTASSMILVGKNYAGYGEFLDENFIHALENSSNPTAPPAPLTGQLWWDKANNLLKVYQGTAWKVVNAATASSTAPGNNVTGELWYDTSNQQLKVWTGAAFLTVGPAYSSATGTAGAIPETINDNTAVPHLVTTIYVNNVRVAVISQDAFTPASPISTSFPYIYAGITLNVALASSTTYAGNVVSVTGNVTGSYFNGVGASLSGNIVSSLNVTGNVAGGNIRTVGQISSTGNLTTANASVSGLISSVGNVTGGNIITSGIVNSTGNITGGNIDTSGLITATGNITSSANIAGANLIMSGLATVVGNVQAGNVRTTGLISATGNITSAGNAAATYFIGNGSQLTGISAAISVTKIENGTSNVRIGAVDGNVSMSVAGTGNVIVVDSTTMYANVVSVQSIAKTGTNAIGNIGSSSNYFNQVFATATTALYADVAERFAADELLEPGTVVELGGTKEITRSRTPLSENVFGVISTRPAYTMNGGAGDDDTHPKVAMTGRVPVMVVGLVKKGDRLVSAGDGIARAAAPGEATAFNTIGRALEDKLSQNTGPIEAIVTIK